MTENIIYDILSFFKNIFEDFGRGVLFFGGPLEIVLAFLDILITTFIIYFVLKLIRDSRAWQVLKGIILIVVLSQLFTLIGLQTIGFILTSTLSVLAIAFVVIFQPELRRALETVGRSSFTFISGVVNQDAQVEKNIIYSMIDSIVRAVEKMSETETGALVIIERETKLGELTDQDNAVAMDSAVSATLLLQIFYKGSPLHDGAVLIRNGRISAARCHVPLSDNYKLRKDFGTRHRAAIGASEMGDAIAVVVSEETGGISITIGGRIYSLDNSDALRSILHKQLNAEGQGGVLYQFIKGKKSRKKEPEISQDSEDSNLEDINGQEIPKNKPGFFARIKYIFSFKPESAPEIPKKNRLIMIMASLTISVLLWFYVQITINPVETESFNVPLTIEGIEELEERNLTYSLVNTSVNVTIKGRSRNMTNLGVGDMIAIVDLSGTETIGRKVIPVSFSIKKLAYFRKEDMNPAMAIVEISEQE